MSLRRLLLRQFQTVFSAFLLELKPENLHSVPWNHSLNNNKCSPLMVLP